MCSDHISSVEVIHTESVCVWLSASVLVLMSALCRIKGHRDFRGFQRGHDQSLNRIRTPEYRRDGRMAIRTNFCQKKCICRILSGQNLENFAQRPDGLSVRRLSVSARPDGYPNYFRRPLQGCCSLAGIIVEIVTNIILKDKL